jgi:hypothetical protein
MKVTTVRFGVDLWEFLDREAALVGVSVSQYIREAALTRAAASAAARGEDALDLLGRMRVEGDSRLVNAPHEDPRGSRPSRAVRDAAAAQVSEAKAVRAQSEQASRHAREIAAHSEQAVAQARAHQARATDRK